MILLRALLAALLSALLEAKRAAPVDFETQLEIDEGKYGVTKSKVNVVEHKSPEFSFPSSLFETAFGAAGLVGRQAGVELAEDASKQGDEDGSEDIDVDLLQSSQPKKNSRLEEYRKKREQRLRSRPRTSKPVSKTTATFTTTILCNGKFHHEGKTKKYDPSDPATWCGKCLLGLLDLEKYKRCWKLDDRDTSVARQISDIWCSVSTISLTKMVSKRADLAFIGSAIATLSAEVQDKEVPAKTHGSVKKMSGQLDAEYLNQEGMKDAAAVLECPELTEPVSKNPKSVRHVILGGTEKLHGKLDSNWKVLKTRYEDLMANDDKMRHIVDLARATAHITSSRSITKTMEQQKVAKLANKVAKLWSDYQVAQQFAQPISVDAVRSYATNCLAGYKNYVAYHHAHHAVDVFEFIVTVFWESERLTEEQKKALALAAVCHDFGHPGMNNKAVFNFDKISANLDSSEFKAMEDIYKSSNKEDLKVDAAGKAAGAFCQSSAPWKHNFGAKLLPCQGFLTEGCGKTGESGGCSSLEETYHTDKALGFLKSASLSSYGELVKRYILATDFGNDYSLRLEIYKGNGVNLAGQLAIHIADINAACKENFLWWTAGVIAEFTHQGIIGLSVEDESLSPFPYTLKELATKQRTWFVGVLAWFMEGVPVVGEKAAIAIAGHADRLDKNIGAWENCAEKLDDSVLTIPDSDARHEAFKNLKEASDAKHVKDLAKHAKSLLGWTQLEIREAMIKQAKDKCNWDPSVGSQPAVDEDDVISSTATTAGTTTTTTTTTAEELAVELASSLVVPVQ